MPYLCLCEKQNPYYINMTYNDQPKNFTTSYFVPEIRLNSGLRSHGFEVDSLSLSSYKKNYIIILAIVPFTAYLQ